MLVTDSKERELLLNNVVQRSVLIVLPNCTEQPNIPESKIVSESMSLTRSIIDGKELKFGGGIASQFKIKVFDINTDLTGEIIQVQLKTTVRPLLYPSETLFPSDSLYPCGATLTYTHVIFTGKIDSNLRQKDRRIKEIIAYDDFYSNSKYVYAYMSGLAQHSPTTKLGQLRNTIEYQLEHIDDEATVLFNDEDALSLSVPNVEKSIQSGKTTTTDILAAYAELNASFAIMDPNNKLKYIQLKQSTSEYIDCYLDLEWEEYTTAPITGIRFSYGGDNNLMYQHNYDHASSGTNVYSSNNIITKSCTNIESLVKSFYIDAYNNKLFGNLYRYRPYKATLFEYWWLEPGDKVQIKTGVSDTPSVTSFIFSVTITGIQNIKTKISAEGDKYLGKDEMT